MRRLLLTVLSALCILLALQSCQHLEPRWLIDRLPGDYPEVTYYFPIGHKSIALSIDDGPDPQATPALLAVLAAHNARATFFLVSDAMQAHPELVQSILDAGHEIGNHMTEDEPSARLPAAEFVDKLETSAAVIDRYKTTLPTPAIRWFRPGNGFYNAAMKEELAQRGYRIALASMLPMDARLRAPGFMAGYIKRSVGPGSIVVLHSVGERGLRAAATLEALLPELAKRDYSVNTLSEIAALAERP